MTQGFYEQLGVERSAGREGIQDAYSKVVAQLVRRRRALMDQGGDTSRLDLARSQVDEAWAVLSDPAKRRRYDALVGLADKGMPTDPEILWEQVRGALVSPASASAVDLVNAMTHISVGAVPPAFDVPVASRRVDPDEPTQAFDTQADVPTEAFPDALPQITAVPTLSGIRMPPPPRHPSPRTPEPAIERSNPVGRPAIVMPSASGPVATQRAQPSGDVKALVSEHGYGGALIHAVRTAKGMSVHDLGEATRISVRYLSAIEGDDYEHLPSTTFVRGYLKEIARTLGLDATELVNGYMRRITR